MSGKKTRWCHHYQFQLENRTYYGTFPSARSETEARKLERDEKAKVRLGLHQENKPIDGDFCTFVNNTYLKYARENKKSYKHDEFRCKILLDYFAGKRFSSITMLDVVRFIKYRLSTKIKRHNQRSELSSPGVLSMFTRKCHCCLQSSAWL